MKQREDWKTYFLGVAAMISQRSTCLRRHYGAVIVDENNKIVSTGYNGAARGRDNCCDLGYCLREQMNVPHGERYELCEAIHGELNAIINGDPKEMKGSTLYIFGYDADDNIVDAAPCLMCQRAIANAQIKEVVYMTPEGPVTYFSDPNRINYYQVSLRLHNLISERFLSVSAKDETEAKEIVKKRIENHLPAITRYIQTELKQIHEDISDTEEFKIQITDVKKLSYEEYQNTLSWMIPVE